MARRKFVPEFPRAAQISAALMKKYSPVTVGDLVDAAVSEGYNTDDAWEIASTHLRYVQNVNYRVRAGMPVRERP